jgi:predicted N-acetyltransferase YhbS
MDFELRLETVRDFRTTEELTREAFWNMYVPGCSEHLILHKMRQAKEFVSELDFVALKNGRIIGNIVYARTRILRDPGNPATPGERGYEAITFGPLSVLPEEQSQGVGSALVEQSLRRAAEMGFRVVLIHGDPEYYKRFGFQASREFHITNSEGKYPAALLALALYPGAIRDTWGRFDYGDLYDADEKELEAFDRTFPPKEKGFKESQNRFQELSGINY